jgi:hypothetical protein
LRTEEEVVLSDWAESLELVFNTVLLDLSFKLLLHSINEGGIVSLELGLSLLEE